MNRFAARINIQSLLVATMSVCACLLMLDSTAFAQAAAATKSNDQSRQYVGIHLLPVAEVIVNHILKSPEVDQSAGFEFLIEGDRDSDGALSNITITQASGDVKLKQAVDELVAALNSSRLLTLLSEAKHLRLKLNSNNGTVTGLATYKSQSVEHASMMAHGYDAMIYAYGSHAGDYAPIYRALKATSSGDEVTIAFAMPRETFCALLSKYLSSN
jgi:hypothetical protein